MAYLCLLMRLGTYLGCWWMGELGQVANAVQENIKKARRSFFMFWCLPWRFESSSMCMVSHGRLRDASLDVTMAWKLIPEWDQDCLAGVLSGWEDSETSKVGSNSAVNVMMGWPTMKRSMNVRNIEKEMYKIDKWIVLAQQITHPQQSPLRRGLAG